MDTATTRETGTMDVLETETALREIYGTPGELASKK